MIEKMKKVTLLTLQGDRDQSLERLRDLGVMHVHLADTRETTDLAEVSRDLDGLERTIEALEPHAEAEGNHFLPPLFLEVDPIQLVDQITGILDEQAFTREELATWEHAAEQSRPWGTFDHELLLSLRMSGLDVRLCEWPPDQQPEFEDDVFVREIYSSETLVYAVVMSLGRITAHVREVHVSQQPIAIIEENIQICRDRLAYREHELQVMAAYLEILRDARVLYQERKEFLMVRNSMEAADRVLVLEGYVPARKVESLTTYAAKHGWGLIIDDPDEDDIHVPTEITMPKWLEVSRPIFDFIGIQPGYREFDISAWFLLFLSVFFAMIIGDAGYGLIIVGGAVAGKIMLKEKSQVTMNLLVIFGVATVIWGAVTGNYFGIPEPKLPGFLQALEIPWLATDPNKDAHVQFICFLLGAGHLSLAHIWKALIAAPHPKALSQIGWVIFLWANFLLAVGLICTVPAVPFMAPFMKFTVPMYIVGAVMVLLFTAPSRNPLKVVGNGMAALVGSGINSFVDLLSYIRLFAVGLSSYYVADSFNNMGVGMANGFLGVIVAVIVIVLGHALNLALCGLGVLVHGVRLNTLEFSGHLDMVWAGVPFRPFIRRFRK